jgi:membrane protein required for beta-lactamase induction
MTTPSDPLALLRSRSYVALLMLAAIIGVPVSAAAYFFLALVSKLRRARARLPRRSFPASCSRHSRP